MLQLVPLLLLCRFTFLWSFLPIVLQHLLLGTRPHFEWRVPTRFERTEQVDVSPHAEEEERTEQEMYLPLRMKRTRREIQAMQDASLQSMKVVVVKEVQCEVVGDQKGLQVVVVQKQVQVWVRMQPLEDFFSFFCLDAADF